MSQKKRFRYAALLLSAFMTLTAWPAALAEETPEMPVLGFENRVKQGFTGRGYNGEEALTVTDEAAYAGDHSLLVTGRTQPWHGPSLNVTYYAEPGTLYAVSVWVLPKTPDSAEFSLTTQVGEGAGAQYYSLDTQTASGAGGWTELSGRVAYPESGYIAIHVECGTADAEFYIDEVGFRQAGAGDITQSIALPSLHEIYKDHFLFGAAVVRSDLSGQRFELIKRHFNALTVGNEMKPAYLGRGNKEHYEYASADDMVGRILEEGMPVHGHTLVWNQQSADWLNLSGGNPLTRAEAKANLELYISTVAGHYAGRVISWDVVNEAFDDNPNTPADWRDALRKSAPWYQAYENGADDDAGESGADYIYDAFVFARLADPGAVLYYLDFNEEFRGKREAIALMTEVLNKQWKDDPRNAEPGRLLVEGLGLQAHYYTGALNPRDVEETIKRWAQTGAELSVSELDIPNGTYNNYRPLTEADEIKQATLYAQLMQIFMDYSDVIARVTIWGINDPTSWRKEGEPLLFDKNHGAKPVYYAVADPAGFLSGRYDDIKSEIAGESTAVPAAAPPGPAPEAPSGSGETESPPPTPDATGDNGETPSGNGPPGWIFAGLGAAGLAGVIAVVLLRRKK